MTGQAGRFGSVVTAMVTPFRDDDHAVDLDGAQQLASWLVDNGSDAIVVAGSTGESPTLSAKEKAELFRAVGEAIRGRGQADLRDRHVLDGRDARAHARQPRTPAPTGCSSSRPTTTSPRSAA